jgi:SHS2 domain-containing protein
LVYDAGLGFLMSGHRAIDHTADVAVELWADDFAGLLAEGARAIVELLTDGADVAGSDERTIELEGQDDEIRLVRWLNEVIWLATGEGFLVVDATLERTADGLRGRARGRCDATLVTTELKSVTYHDLAIVHDAGQLRARVVVDI